MCIKRVARMLVEMLAASALCWMPQAHSWNESGHRVIAAAAARQMPADVRDQMVQLLKAHPRYKKDLVRYQPRRMTALTEAEWLLGQAAQWPDRARRFNNEPRRKRDKLVEKYHHGNWHYINLPIYLTAADKTLRIKDPTDGSRTGQNSKPADVLQALNFIQDGLGDPNVSDSDKGLWISWALHLIADVHQPLHTSAMFSADRWPRGDRGGNEVKILGSGKSGGGRKGRLDSLHYFWDSAISNRREPREVHALIGVLEEQQIFDVVGNEVDPVMWIREGARVATEVVYGPLRAQLLDSPVVAINADYTQRAHAVSLNRAALAARRTALWFSSALPASNSSAQE